jgi:Na+/H+ antiporter NhaA
VDHHQKLIDIVEPFSAFFVVPIFIFVSLFRNFDFSFKSMGSSLVMTLIIARIIGKPSGIFLGIQAGRLLLKTKLPFSMVESFLIGALGTLGLAVSLIFAQNDFLGIRQDRAVMAILLTIPFGIALSSLIRFISVRKQ